MAITLDGGCRVAGLKEGEPHRDGALEIWEHFGGAFSTRVIEVNGTASLRNESVDEVLYVLECGGKAAALLLDSKAAALPQQSISIGVDTSIYLPAGSTIEITGESLTLFSCRCPGSDLAEDGGRDARAPTIVSLEEKPLQKTGDRWYRELVTAEVTQFVGVIPPGRAPDHFHLYEEVICILEGTGAMWAGESNTPIAEGSCIFLPRRQMHCVENRGEGNVRLLGVFYPAGSPAVRYS